MSISAKNRRIYEKLNDISDAQRTLNKVMRSLEIPVDSAEYRLIGVLMVLGDTSTENASTQSTSAITVAFTHNAEPRDISVSTEQLQAIIYNLKEKYHTISRNPIRAAYYRLLGQIAAKNMRALTAESTVTS